MACQIGAAVIDDPREFGNWCKHGFELLEQERRFARDERQLVAMQGGRTAQMGGDQVPLAEAPVGAQGPSYEQAARWQERFERNAAAGQYRQADDVAPQFVREYARTQVPNPNDLASIVREAIQRELASAREAQYAASVVPNQTQQAWPQQAPVMPTPQWTSGGGPGPTPAGGYVVPGRRY